MEYILKFDASPETKHTSTTPSTVLEATHRHTLPSQSTHLLSVKAEDDVDFILESSWSMKA